jgi:hypothetical protein
LFKWLYYHCVKGCVFVGGNCFKTQAKGGECTDFGSNSGACESTENTFIPLYPYDKVVEVDDNNVEHTEPAFLSCLIIFF